MTFDLPISPPSVWKQASGKWFTASGVVSRFVTQQDGDDYDDGTVYASGREVCGREIYHVVRIKLD